MQCVAQARGIECIDCESAVAALRAAWPAGKPGTSTIRRLSQSGIHNLHELSVRRRQVHGT